MNAGIKKVWVEALKSGNYPQTTGHLIEVPGETGVQIEQTGYCCLGVLCEVMGVPKVTIAYTGYKDEAEPFTGVTHYFLPKNVEVEAELGRIEQTILAEKNDNLMSFGEIATYIEEQL
jgi:hypothetical protein